MAPAKMTVPPSQESGLTIRKTLSKVARSADAATDSTRFHADLATTRDVRAVVIPDHNLSRSAQLRTRASRMAEIT